VGWTKVKTEKAAMADLESGKYYFAIVIPEDFSAAVASPTGEQPRQAKIAEVTAELNDAVAKLQAVDLPPAQEVAWRHSFRRPRGG
jgi:uncharacterized phage infection (PIP) family protein YhgE